MKSLQKIASRLNKVKERVLKISNELNEKDRFKALVDKAPIPFVMSVWEQYLSGRRLSEKQKQVIDDIASKKGLGYVFQKTEELSSTNILGDKTVFYLSAVQARVNLWTKTLSDDLDLRKNYASPTENWISEYYNQRDKSLNVLKTKVNRNNKENIAKAISFFYDFIPQFDLFTMNLEVGELAVEEFLARSKKEPILHRGDSTTSIMSNILRLSNFLNSQNFKPELISELLYFFDLLFITEEDDLFRTTDLYVSKHGIGSNPKDAYNNIKKQIDVWQTTNIINPLKRKFAEATDEEEQDKVLDFISTVPTVKVRFN